MNKKGKNIKKVNSRLKETDKNVQKSKIKNISGVN